MPINPTMVLDFAQRLGQQQPLSQLGQRITGVVQQGRQRKQMEQAQAAYQQAQAAYNQNPTPQNLQALYQASAPLGLFDATRAGVLDSRQPEGEAVAAQMSPEQRAALTARYNQLGRIVATNYSNQAADEYMRLAETLGLDVEEARQRVQLFRPEGAEEQESPLNTAPVIEAFRSFERGEGTRDDVFARAYEAGVPSLATDLLDGLVTPEQLEEQTTNVGPVIEAFEAFRIGEGDWATVVERAYEAEQPEMIDDLLDRYNAEQEVIAQEQLRADLETTVDSIAESYIADPTGQSAARLELDAVQIASRLGNTGDAQAMLNMIQTGARAQALDTAMRRMRDTFTPESVNAAIDLARASGQTEAVEAEIARLTDAEKSVQLDRFAGVLTPLVSGNTDIALEAIDDLIASYRAEGDMEEVRGLTAMRNQIRDGELDGAMTEFALDIGLLGTDGAQQYLEGLSQVRQEVRNRALTDAELLRVGTSIEYPSEEARQEAMALADGLPGGYGRQILELSSVVSQSQATGEPLDMRDVFDIEESLRREYDTYTQPYRDGMRAAQQIRNLVQTNNTSGFTDAALTTLFQRALDPDSVVRESEAARTEAAQGYLDRAFMALNRIANGQQYNPDARADLLAAVNIVTAAYEELESSQRTRLQNTLREVWGSDSSNEYTRSLTRVFPEHQEGTGDW